MTLILPQATPDPYETERALLSACMNCDLTYLDEAVDRVDIEDFYSDAHRVIWRWMLAERHAGRRPDVLTLFDWMQAGGQKRIDACGGLVFATSLGDATHIPQHIPRYAELVAEAGQRRRLSHSLSRLQHELREGQAPEAIVTKAQALLEGALGNMRSQTSMMSAREEIWPWRERVRLRHERLADGVLPGFSTGFAALDRYVRLHRKKLALIAGRPSMGKSQLVMQMVDSLALEARAMGPDGVVLVFSLEMGKDELMNRWISARSGVPYEEIDNGHSVGVGGERLPLSARQWEAIDRACQDFAELPLEFDDTPGRSIGQIRRECLRWSRRRDVVGVSLDYLQLAAGEGENKVEELTNIADGGKKLAMEIDAAVIMAAQLNRGPQQRTDKRPVPSDLRGSGGLEQAADVLLGLYRDDFYNKQFSEAPNTAEVIVMKNRGGPKNVTARLGFRHGVFHDLDQRPQLHDPDAF